MALVYNKELSVAPSIVYFENPEYDDGRKDKMNPTRLAVSEGADCPRFEFLILTRLLCSTDPEIVLNCKYVLENFQDFFFICCKVKSATICNENLKIHLPC